MTQMPILFPSQAVHGNLSFATYQSADGKQAGPPITAMRDANAKKNDAARVLNNGDMIFIYAENAFSAAVHAKICEEDLFELWQIMQGAEIFNELDGLSESSQENFERNSEEFLYNMGFLKRNKSDVPYDISNPPPVQKNITREYGHSFMREDGASLMTQPLFDVLCPRDFVQNRQDLIYSGIVDLDDYDYTLHMTIGDREQFVSFHGLQRGFDPEDWAHLTYFQHRVLIIRPAYGAA